MSQTKPTTHKDSDAPKKQRVFAADFADFVAATAAGLGDGWAVDTDSKPHPGPSAFLAHPDGRRIGIKHIWRGEAVQTWALDVPPREFEDSRDAELYADSLKHLTPGIRYNVGVCFTNNPPAATTARNIRNRLLPAFDGKRPPLRAFPKKRPGRGSRPRRKRQPRTRQRAHERWINPSRRRRPRRPGPRRRTRAAQPRKRSHPHQRPSRRSDRLCPDRGAPQRRPPRRRRRTTPRRRSCSRLKPPPVTDQFPPGAGPSEAAPHPLHIDRSENCHDTTRPVRREAGRHGSQVRA